MSVRKSLLLIQPYTAFPQTSGGRTRIFHTVQELHKYFNLTVWGFVVNKQEEFLQLSWLKKMKISSKYFLIKPKKIFSFLLTGQPYWFSDWYSQELKQFLKGQSKDFSTIQVESSQLLYLVNFLPKTSKKVFVSYDVSSLSFFRRLRTEKNFLKKILHWWRFLEIYLYEWRYLPKFDVIIAVSEHDAALLRNHFRLKNVVVVPNGIKKINFLPSRKKDGYLNLGYIGSFAHTPNFEAVNFLINKIFPELESQNSTCKLYLAGANSSQLLKQLIEKSPVQNKAYIINLGRIDRTESFFKKIDVLVAPIFAGSGTKIKILESLSYGKPVITTRIGAEGINIKSSFLKVLSKKDRFNSKKWTREILNFKKIDFDYGCENKKLLKELSKMTWEKVFNKNYGSF